MTMRKLTLSELAAAIDAACTPKQVEILEQLADGKSEREIARNLGVARSTIRDRRAAAYRRINQHLTNQENAA